MLLSGGNIAFGQAEDSTIAVPGGKTRYTFLQRLSHSPDVLQPLDTMLTGFVESFNPGYLHNLGNMGSPVFPLVWQMPRVSGFRFGFQQWDFLRLSKENIPYFNTQNPFTELRYIQGPEKFQIINGVHTQNISPNWNIGLQLKREGSEGYYAQQNARNGNLGANTWYRSPNRRYLVAASAIFNDFSFEENGGMQSTANFEIDSLGSRQRRGLDVKLSDARQTFSDKEFTIKQILYFGASESMRVAGDSDSVSVKILKPRFFITQQSNYYTQNYFYKDTIPTRSFYPETIDTVLTADNYSYNNFSNRAGLGYIFSDSAHTRNISVQAYLKYDFIHTHIKNFAGNLHNSSIGFDGRKDGRLALNFSGEMVLEGYNSGDFFADANATSVFLPALKMSNITFFGRTQNYSPAYIEKYYISNHTGWLDDDFKQTQSISAGGYIWDSATALKLGASYTAASNYIYFGNDALPQQAAKDLQYFQLNVARNFVLGNFHFNHDITYQAQLQGNYIRIPNLVIRTSYFYQNRIFKGKPLLLQTGVDFSYNSAYKGYSYMPGISKFYLQDAVTIGNYPVFDVWAAGQVKRFMFFFKVQHVTQDLLGYRYYNAIGYPMQPRTFRFGLKWRFYN